MANEGELPAWLAPILAASTFVGGALAAVIGRKKKTTEPDTPGNGEAMLAQRVSALELLTQTHSNKFERIETDRRESRETLKDLFEKIDKTQEDVSEIKGILKGQGRK